MSECLPTLTVDYYNCKGIVTNFDRFLEAYPGVDGMDLMKDWVRELDYLLKKDAELYNNGSADQFQYPLISRPLSKAKLTLSVAYGDFEGRIGRVDAFFTHVHPEIRKDLLCSWHREMEYLYLNMRMFDGPSDKWDRYLK